MGDKETYPITLHAQHLRASELETQPITSHYPTGEPTHPINAQYTKDSVDTSAHSSEPCLRRTSGQSETIHAKYMLGCDGAHSWTREQLGLRMEGESTDTVWGVMDIMPMTDFPE